MFSERNCFRFGDNYRFKNSCHYRVNRPLEQHSHRETVPKSAFDKIALKRQIKTVESGWNNKAI